MTRFPLATAAALAGLGLFCGCAGPGANTTSCGEPREGFFSRMMSGFRGGRHEGDCPCVETGRVTVGEGPIVPEPGCGSPGCAAQEFPSTGFPSQGYPTSIPVVPTMPPPTALPLPGGAPQAQPVPANPSSVIKNAAK